jgi:putative protease
MELLAPAGDPAAFDAALAAGADAVYLGLRSLNARRGAANFTQPELAAAVQTAHARGAKVYLTLNIDLSQRELGQAARALKLAHDASIDAVLVRDPALLALQPFFPSLQFHFSTQSCIASSADVEAARRLGASRVVLAREMSLDEIAAASQVPGIETEVFVQGALCFCISGRCFLSSWIGGRSGNRGLCTSPCRVPYSAGEEPLGTPLSMHDLSLVARINELAAAGVRALKIEGRLKSPGWVARAVSLFRRALAGETPQTLLDEAAALGAYTGRQLTDDYLDAQRFHLTAQAAGRQASPPVDASPAEGSPASPAPTPPAGPGAQPLAVSLDVTDQGIVCTATLAGRANSWRIPRTVVRRENRAVSIGSFLQSLEGTKFHDAVVQTTTSNQPGALLVPRAANGLVDQLSVAVRQLLKEEDDLLRLDLPDEVRIAIRANTAEEAAVRSANPLTLGQLPSAVRLEARAVGNFVRQVRQAGRGELLPGTLIVEGLSAHSLEKTLASAASVPFIAALPLALFERDLQPARELAAACAAAHVPLEANTWSGWQIASHAGIACHAGPGLGVLNPLAARKLAQLGFASVTASIEADRRQLEELSSHLEVPLSILIFGRPALMTSRVDLSPIVHSGGLIADRRHNEFVPRLEGGLWVFRPPHPFDLRGLRNVNIRAAHLVADLVTSPSPTTEFLRRPQPGDKPFRFNYGRTLA